MFLTGISITHYPEILTVLQVSLSLPLPQALVFVFSSSYSANMSLITHVVAFRYSSTTSAAERSLIASKFVALQDSCKLANTDDKYILSLSGGAQNSMEGMDKKFDVRGMWSASSAAGNALFNGV